MAKGRRRRSGGRVTPKGTRPAGFRERERHQPDYVEGLDEEGLELMRDIQQAAAEDSPLGILALASTFLSMVDPRSQNPLERDDDQDGSPSREDVLRSFLDIDVAETSAILVGIQAITDDGLERARIERELARRHHRLPRWGAGLGSVEAYQAIEMVHVLGDGDDIIVGARLASGEELTAVTYIDHNLGSVVKDAFVMPDSIEALVALMKSHTEDPDCTFRELGLADARTRITEAIRGGAMMFPPLESDTWPSSRPLVEWIVSLLPEGGRDYERPEWGEEAVGELKARFLQSSFGKVLSDPDYAELLDSVLWFGTDYGPGDPMRWSPTSVEIILMDWIPRKIVAPAEFLDRAPTLLRAFVQFCHAERGIRAALTEETLGVIDEFEPEYRQTIRSPRRQGPVALLAAMGALDPDEGWTGGDGNDDDAFGHLLWNYEEVMHERLVDDVGGESALARLDATPLADEPFVSDGIPHDIVERVGAVVALCDRCCDEVLDAEYRTACRRLIATVAVGDPEVFRRKASLEGAAAAVCWIIGKANDLFSPAGRGLLVKDLMAEFGTLQSNVSTRAATLLKAGGFDQDRYGIVSLGSPAYLVASRRRRIIELRERSPAGRQ